MARDENLYSYEARRDRISGDPTLYCVDIRDPRSGPYMSATEIKGSQPYVDASIRKVPGAMGFLEQEGKTELSAVNLPFGHEVFLPNRMGFFAAINPLPYSIPFVSLAGAVLRKLGLRR